MGSNGADRGAVGEARTNHLLEAVSRGLIVIDAAGTFLDCNELAAEILGMTRAQMIGQSINEFRWRATRGDGSKYLPDERPITRSVERGETVLDVVLGMRRPDDSIVWLTIDVRPILDALGEPTATMLMTIADIGHRRALERTLRTLSRGNSVLVHSTDELQLLRDMCATIVQSGGYALAWVGVATNDGERSVRVVAAAGDTGYLDETRTSVLDGDPLGQSPTGQALRTGEVQFADDLQLCPDFETWRDDALDYGFGASLSIPMTFPFGARAALVIYTRDAGAFDDSCVALLTELAADLAFGVTQLRLRAQHMSWSAALPLIMLVLDTDGNVVEHNPAAVRCVASAGDDAAGRAVPESFTPALRDLLPPAVRNDPGHPLWVELASGLDRDVELAPGHTRPVRFWAAPIVTPAHEVVGFTVAGQDITELRILEAQIRQAQKMESIGNLAGGIAHDVNNLLTVMLVTCDVMRSRSASADDVQRGLTTLRQSIDSAASLTQQLLAFGRRQVLVPIVVELSGLVAESCQMLVRIIGDDVTLITDFAPEPIYVRVDPVQIEQVLVNFIVNARQAMPDGGTLTVTTATGPGELVRFSVADTGTGIAPELLDRIFEPFFTTKPATEGTGLGLATADGIVRQSGGRIDVVSAVGVGTTFTVSLPVSHETPTVRATLQPVPDPIERQGDAERLLVVEDDAAVRAAVTSVLADAGYQLLIASSAEQALEMVASNVSALDLLVTDVTLPGLTGWQLAMKLDIPTVIVSGNSHDLDVPPAVAEGSWTFLAKPFTGDALLRTIRRQLARSKQ